MNKIVVVAWVLVGLLVAQTVTFLSLMIWWRQVRVENLHPTESTFCLPCTDLVTRGHSAAFMATVQHLRQEKNESKCCGTTSEMMALLANKTVNENYYNNYEVRMAQKLKSECTMTDGDKPSTSLNGVRDVTQDGDKYKLIWDTEHMEVTHPQLRVNTAGDIVIKRPGYYFVYSQLGMRNNNVSVIDTMYRHFVHRRVAENGRDEVILEARHSFCEKNEPHFEEVSSIGGLFELGFNDRLSVVTDRPEYLVKQSDTSVMNVYYTSSVSTERNIDA